MIGTWATGAAMILGIGLHAAAQSAPGSGVAPGAQPGVSAADGTPVRRQVLFNRYQTPVMTVFIADADGANARPLAPAWGLEYSPSFSADGQWVVFTAEPDGQADLYRIRPDGTGLEQLTNHPAFDDQGALSPDGRTLAFVSTRERGTADIWLLDLAAGTGSNLTDHPSGNFRPRWSPDGAWIAFTSDRDARPGDLPGSWEHLQSTGVYLVRPDGTGLRRLTGPGGVAGSPSWSADGRRVLFYETDPVGAYLAKSGRSRTELVSVDVVTGERIQHPSWSPDGDRLVFKGGRRLFVVPAAGGPRVALTGPGYYSNFPQWSPDGERILFTANRGGDFDLYTVRPDGADIRQLTRAPGNDAHSSWCAGGDWVVFSSARMGFKDEMALYDSVPQPYGEIFAMRADGADLRQLTDNKWEDSGAVCVPDQVGGL